MDPVEHHKITINPPAGTEPNKSGEDDKKDEGSNGPVAPAAVSPFTSPPTPVVPDSSSNAVWHMPDASSPDGPKDKPAEETKPVAFGGSDTPNHNSLFDSSKPFGAPGPTVPNTFGPSAAVSSPPILDPDPPVIPVVPAVVSVSSGGDDGAGAQAFSPSLPADPNEVRPVPVVRVLSPVGIEYVFMTFCLFTGAIGLASALISLVNGKFEFSVLAFPVALLVVSVPVFSLLFLRLKKMEYDQPSLKLDPSKRRSTQFTQITSFAVCLFTLIGLVYAIFAKLGGQSPLSIGKAILDSLCILVVAGGILAYYFYNEHKA